MGVGGFAPAMASSSAARILAAAAGLGIVVFAAGLGFFLSAFPFTLTLLAVTTFVAALALALLAGQPRGLQDVLARFTRIRLEDGGHVGAAALMVVALWYVFGVGLTDGAFALESAARGATSAAELDPGALVRGLALNLVMLTFPVLVYVSFVGGRSPQGALSELGLDARDARRGALSGLLLAVAFNLALIVLGAILTALKVTLPENERALEIARQITPLGAIGIALVAGVSEEVFFRGFLLPRIGLVAQAILFSLVHLSYVNALEIAFTLALGLVLGYVRRRTGSLWAPIVAHFAFDLIQLLGAMYLPRA